MRSFGKTRQTASLPYPFLRRRIMFTRRSFRKGAAALGAATASFNENGMARALDAVRCVSGRGADGVAGDEVLTTNQDYPRMLPTWRPRERREGIVVKKISITVP